MKPQIQFNTGLSVRYQTALCDRHGKIERILQEGTNMITDWGMDAMATTTIADNCDYLHLGSTTETLKRVLPGGNSITLSGTDPAGITVTAASNFFEAADAGRVLKIAGWPELLVTAFTSATVVTVRSRASLWPPGFTPPGTGPFTDVGIHYTNVATLATEFTRYNTKDTGAANNDAELNDEANSRFIIQKIFLSAEVTGSSWTVNELGWGPNTTNCFGKTNLAAPDVIAVGKKYRVLLQVLNAFTPINLSAISLNWGATVGTYTCDVRQERIGKQFSGSSIIYNLLDPIAPGNTQAGWWTGAFTMDTTRWQDGAGWDGLQARTGYNQTAAGMIIDTAYTAGNHRRTRTLRWPDAVAISGATGLWATVKSTFHWPSLTVRPTTGTITKASGHRIDLIFAIAWQRTLSN